MRVKVFRQQSVIVSLIGTIAFRAINSQIQVALVWVWRWFVCMRILSMQKHFVQNLRWVVLDLLFCFRLTPGVKQH